MNREHREERRERHADIIQMLNLLSLLDNFHLNEEISDEKFRRRSERGGESLHREMSSRKCQETKGNKQVNVVKEIHR